MEEGFKSRKQQTQYDEYMAAYELRKIEVRGWTAPRRRAELVGEGGFPTMDKNDYALSETCDEILKTAAIKITELLQETNADQGRLIAAMDGLAVVAQYVRGSIELGSLKN